MASNLNKVFLMGNLTRDPELRYLPSGTAVTNFTIAINRVYTLQTGEKKEETTFMRIVVWARRAETCGEYLSKGSSVFVEGRLQSRSWEGQDGQKRNTVEVVADNVQFLGRPKKTSAERLPEPSQGPMDIVPDVDIPSSNSDIKVGTSNNKPNEEEVPF